MSNNLIAQPDWWPHSHNGWRDLVRYFSRDSGLLAGLSRDNNWCLLPEGSANTNYRLSLKQQDYFIQITNQQNALLQPKEGSSNLSKLLSKNPTLNPWLVPRYFASNEVKIDQWIVTQSGAFKSFSNEIFIDALVDFLAKLHSIETPQKNSTLNSQSINIKEYLERYRQLALRTPNSPVNNIESLYHQALQIVDVFSADTFCHNDLSLSNILCTKPNSLKIIDWEYCSISDRYLELANLISNTQLTPRQEAVFLKKYQEKMQLIIDLQKLNSIKKLALSINSLWFIAADKQTL